MKLGSKILFAIALSLGLMLSITYISSPLVIKKSYNNLEKNQFAINYNAIDGAVAAVINANSAFSISWSVYSAMFDYAAEYLNPTKKKKNESFLKAALTPSAMQPGKVDFFLLFDRSGNLVNSLKGEFRDNWTKIVPLSTKISDLFQPKGPYRHLVFPAGTNSDAMGLISIDGQMFITASHQVLPDTGIGKSNGTLIFGQAMANVWAQIEDKSNLDLTLYSPSDIKKDPLLNKEFLALTTKKNGKNIVLQNEETAFLYNILKDINDNPIGMIKNTVPRKINLLSISTTRYFNIAFVLTALSFSLLLFYMLRFLLINRLAKINNKIIRIGATKNLSLRVPQDSVDDEVSSMALEINGMLSTIEKVENLLSDIINSMPSSIVLIDHAMRVTKLSDFAKKETMTSGEEAIGKSLFELFPYLEEHKNQFTEALQKQIHKEINNVLYTLSEEDRYFNIVMYPFIRAGEQTMALRIDDVSLLTKIEKKLKQSDTLAVIGSLTAGIAYEIDHPLTAIFNAVTSLEKDMGSIFNSLQDYEKAIVDNTEADFRKKISIIAQIGKAEDFDFILKKMKEIVSSAKNEAQQIAEIVKSLKIFVRLDEDVIKKINIHEGIDAILVLLKHDYKDRINIIRDYGVLPGIDCFPSRINQVFMNIITNAIDAIPDQGEITIKTECENENIKISIKDSGAGLSEEDLSKIFNPFFRSNSDAQKPGANLSIASSIVHDHKGTIEAKSQLGKGTEIIVVLPQR